MNMFEIKVPDIGDFKGVEVIELLVKPGDTVKIDQSVMTVESDKASMEIPSSHAGVVKEWKVNIGDTVAQGSLVLMLEGTETVSAAPATAAAAAVNVAPAAAVTPGIPALVTATHLATSAASHAPVVSSALAHASPSVRKFARELGVSVAQVPGSGPKGRITQHDVQTFIKAAIAGSALSGAARQDGAGLNLLAWPALDFSKFGETALQPLPRIKKISGPNLHRNWVMIPHVTQFEDADVTDLEAFRISSNEKNREAAKLTMLAFVIKAAVAALKNIRLSTLHWTQPART